MLDHLNVLAQTCCNFWEAFSRLISPPFVLSVYILTFWGGIGGKGGGRQTCDAYLSEYAFFGFIDVIS